MGLIVEVKGIAEGAEIPSDLTCDGRNTSPEISIVGASPETKSFALVVEDPDAPVGLFVHWVIYNISGTTNTLNGNIEKTTKTKEGFLQGKNDFNRIGYDGPCPPKGHGYHRYYFRLFALRESPSLEGSVDRERLLKSIEGITIEQATVMGRYKR